MDTVLAASAATAGMVLLATSIKNNIDPAEARHMLRATGIVVGGALAVGVFGLSSNVGFENVRQCRQSYGTETGR